MVRQTAAARSRRHGAGDGQSSGDDIEGRERTAAGAVGGRIVLVP
jgi:hypothetical protein